MNFIIYLKLFKSNKNVHVNIPMNILVRISISFTFLSLSCFLREASCPLCSSGFRSTPTINNYQY